MMAASISDVFILCMILLWILHRLVTFWVTARDRRTPDILDSVFSSTSAAAAKRASAARGRDLVWQEPPLHSLTRAAASQDVSVASPATGQRGPAVPLVSIPGGLLASGECTLDAGFSLDPTGNLSLQVGCERLQPASPVCSKSSLQPASPVCSKSSLQPASPVCSKSSLQPASPVCSKSSLQPASPVCSKSSLPAEECWWIEAESQAGQSSGSASVSEQEDMSSRRLVWSSTRSTGSDNSAGWKSRECREGNTSSSDLLGSGGTDWTMGAWTRSTQETPRARRSVDLSDRSDPSPGNSVDLSEKSYFQPRSSVDLSEGFNPRLRKSVDLSEKFDSQPRHSVDLSTSFDPRPRKSVDLSERLARRRALRLEEKKEAMAACEDSGGVSSADSRSFPEDLQNGHQESERLGNGNMDSEDGYNTYTFLSSHNRSREIQVQPTDFQCKDEFPSMGSSSTEGGLETVPSVESLNRSPTGPDFPRKPDTSREYSSNERSWSVGETTAQRELWPEKTQIDASVFECVESLQPMVGQSSVSNGDGGQREGLETKEAPYRSTSDDFGVTFSSHPGLIGSGVITDVIEREADVPERSKFEGQREEKLTDQVSEVGRVSVDVIGTAGWQPVENRGRMGSESQVLDYLLQPDTVSRTEQQFENEEVSPNRNQEGQLITREVGNVSNNTSSDWLLSASRRKEWAPPEEEVWNTEEEWSEEEDAWSGPEEAVNCEGTAHATGQREVKVGRKEGSFVSQHASLFEHQAPSLHNSKPLRAGQPSRYTGRMEKLADKREKFLKNSSDVLSTLGTAAVPQHVDPLGSQTPSTHTVVPGRRTDFNALLTKFSSSESPSDKSDPDDQSAASSAVSRRRSYVRRQEGVAPNTGADAGRTPERTQSLKFRVDERTASIVPSVQRADRSVAEVRASQSKSERISGRQTVTTAKTSSRDQSTRDASERLQSGKTTIPGGSSEREPVKTDLSKSSTIAGVVEVGDSHAGSREVSNPLPRAQTTSHNTTNQSQALSSSGASTSHIRSNSLNVKSETLSQQAFKQQQLQPTTAIRSSSVLQSNAGQTQPEVPSGPQNTPDPRSRQQAPVPKARVTSQNRVIPPSNSKYLPDPTDTDAPLKQSQPAQQKTARDPPPEPSTRTSGHSAELPLKQTGGVQLAKSRSVKLETEVQGKAALSSSTSSQPAVLGDRRDSTQSDDNQLANRRGSGSFQESAVSSARRLRPSSSSFPTGSSVGTRGLTLGEDHTVQGTQELHLKEQSSKSVSSDRKELLGLRVSASASKAEPTRQERSLEMKEKPTISENSARTEPWKKDELVNLKEKGQTLKNSNSPTRQVRSTDLQETSQAPEGSLKTESTVPVRSVDLKERSQTTQSLSNLELSKQERSVDLKQLYLSAENLSKVESIRRESSSELKEKSQTSDETSKIEPSRQEMPTDIKERSQTSDKTLKKEPNRQDMPTDSIEKALTSDKTLKIEPKTQETPADNKEKSRTSDKTSKIEPSKQETPIDSIEKSKISESSSKKFQSARLLLDSDSTSAESKHAGPETGSQSATDSHQTKTVQAGLSNTLPCLDEGRQPSPPQLTATTTESRPVPRASEVGQEEWKESGATTVSAHALSGSFSSVTSSTSPISIAPSDLTTTQSVVIPVATTPTVPTSEEGSLCASSSHVRTSTEILSAETKSYTSDSADVKLPVLTAVSKQASFKESSLVGMESERRKGILKRNSSLTSRDRQEAVSSSGPPPIDPQLAKIFQQRKQHLGDLSDPEDGGGQGHTADPGRRSRPISAVEDIQETIKYSQERASERGGPVETEEVLRPVSVAARVHSMQVKMEEEKFSAVPSRGTSGFSTPRSRPRSGLLTPTFQRSTDEPINSLSTTSSLTTSLTAASLPDPREPGVVQQSGPSPSEPGSSCVLSDLQLMDRLHQIATSADTYQERRHRFQNRGQRRQTQPVTSQEIEAVDGYINRKKRERSQTLPVTEEEVNKAVQVKDDQSSSGSGRSRSSSVTDLDTTSSDLTSKEGTPDELTSLSLHEKVKLFSQPRLQQPDQPEKRPTPVLRRRNRQGTASRFNTQPVTDEEVKLAAAEATRISPLAMSMVKPPDYELLQGLPLKDQRELMAMHAGKILSQSAATSGTLGQAGVSVRPASFPARTGLSSSPAGSISMEDKNTELGHNSGDKKGILKESNTAVNEPHDAKSILKQEATTTRSEPNVHSILKTEVKNSPGAEHSSSSIPEPRGILKKTKSEEAESAGTAEDLKGILKHADSDEQRGANDSVPEPRSRWNCQTLVLQNVDVSASQRTTQADSAHSDNLQADVRSILKSASQECVAAPPVGKSAFRSSSVDLEASTASAGRKSALRGGAKTGAEVEDNSNTILATSTGHSDSNSNNAHRPVNLMTQSVDSISVTTAISAVSSSKEVSKVTKMSSSQVTTAVATSQVTTAMSTSQEVSKVTEMSGSQVTTVTSKSSNTLLVPSAQPDKMSSDASDDGGSSSSGELLEMSSTGRATKLKRRSRFSGASVRQERYKTQPSDLLDSPSPARTDVSPRRKYEGRHRTQPITPDEMREAEAATPTGKLTSPSGAGSIADRLNQLKASGEEEWKKRVGRKDEMLVSPEIIKLREKTSQSQSRPSSIADRLSNLETSMTTWKERVEESDARQFTVAGRLTSTTTESPLVNKLKNLTKKEDTDSRNSSPLASPVTPTKEFITRIPLPKDIIQDTSLPVDGLVSKPFFGYADQESPQPVRVEVPDFGQEVEHFFGAKSIEDIMDRVELEVDDFDNIFAVDPERMLSAVHKLRPQRKNKSSSQNPLKTMSRSVEVRQEYTQVLYGTADKEFKRIKKETLAKDAGFAQSALAGLASTENFKQVELRRTDSGSSVHGQAFDPFKELMLLHVKGRRFVQTRIVEPHTRSINEGDCYILVTPEKVVMWEGRFANVIEKAKASEVASFIQQKKDLGCKRAPDVLMVHQNRDYAGAGKVFWSALEGEKQVQACGPDEEDELYEASVVKCNMVFRLQGNCLQPYTDYWGMVPKHEMLKKNEVLVFDFGTELYVWQGKAVTMEQRKLGLRLTKQLFEKGYDYSQSPINPFSPLRNEDIGGLPACLASRPSWAIFGKVNQNMETILFREKFADWPDSSRLIGCKGPGAVELTNKELLELKPYDAKMLVPPNTSPVNLILEGANLGRGIRWSEDMQGFVKEQDIVTLEVTVWHILEYEHDKLSKASHGQFHDGDTYVVRWQYMINNSNLRTLKGNPRNSLTGRERCAYFFWQGNQSTINEKGASALMTVELDEERGPQVRVLQGKEPPCFLNLFEGKMVVHIGKRQEPVSSFRGAWRLYCLRGDYENEMCLQEIPVCVHNFRSRSSLVLLNVKTGAVYIWHGAKSPSHVRSLCRAAVDRWKDQIPVELGLDQQAAISVKEVDEGQERRDFWQAFEGQDRRVYHSLLEDARSYSQTIRLFHMSSVNLVFDVYEQLNPSRVPDLTSPFPFLQSDLYRAAQPALFLIDNEQEVFLWQGWWPAGSQDTDNIHTGSAIARFNLDRRLAMETTLHYCREKNHEHPPAAYLVCAGVEPLSFTNLFPFWEEDSVVTDLQIQEGKTEGYMEPVSSILHRLTATRYTLAELQERPLPEGVDPLRLETYLYDAEFEEILGMSKEEFYAMPAWKQIDLKKHRKLF